MAEYRMNQGANISLTTENYALIITNGTGVDLAPILGEVPTLMSNNLSLAGNTLNITNGTGQ